MLLRSTLPFGRLGVPTQMSETALAVTASAASEVALRRFSCAVAWMSSARPASMTGGIPSLISSIFDCWGSTPITVWPLLARHAAETVPT